MIDHCYDFAEAAHAQGRPIVGIVCEFTPREIILAAGAIPVCLCGGSAATIPAAEQHLPANLCPLIKSTYGYHLSGTNPFLKWADLVVAETTCDGKKKMFELMGQSKPIYVLELPQKADDSAALEHWLEEVRKLKEHLEQRFHVQITNEKLAAAIHLMNRERGLRRQLADLMSADPPPLTGRQLLQFKSIISGLEPDLEQYEQALQFFRQESPRPLPAHAPSSHLTPPNTPALPTNQVIPNGSSLSPTGGENSPNNGSRPEPLNRGALAGMTSEQSPSPIGWERAGVRVHGEGRGEGADRFMFSKHELSSGSILSPSDGQKETHTSPKVRVLLTGVPIVHGAEQVLDLIEDCGAVVVCQENCTGLKPILEDVDAHDPDPIRAIARKYYHLPCSVMTLNRGRFDSLRALAAKFRPHCVIELVWQACLTYDVESHQVRKLAEEELRLPYLKIVTDYSPSDSARLRTRIEALLERTRSQWGLQL